MRHNNATQLLAALYRLGDHVCDCMLLGYIEGLRRYVMCYDQAARC